MTRAEREALAKLARDVIEYATPAVMEVEAAKVLALLARVERLERALEAVNDWRGLDGDGISDPTRMQVKAALADEEPQA